MLELESQGYFEWRVSRLPKELHVTRFRRCFAACLCLCGVLVAGSRLSAPARADDITERAKKLHFSSIVLDTHDDTTQRFFSKGYDIAKRNPDGHVDIPRMIDGGMNAIFFSIWIDGRIMGPPAVQKALDQIDAVHENVRKNSRDMVLCRTAAEVREAHKQGKIAALIGVEGGHMIGNDIRVLRMFGDLGVRYMTLSHFYNDEWADSSTDKPVHNGLTDFGKDIVREMNRQGIMVDISHVSDKTFYDALEVSKAPAAKGGVIQINYERSFIDQAYKDASDKLTGGVVAQFDLFKKECGDDQECFGRKMAEKQKQAMEEGKLPHVSWERIIDHIDHAVKLVGAEHVGLGSDFDGADMPEGMEDCSKLPKITEALMRKGYTDEDIRKILGGNTLRVMEQTEKVSRELQAQ